MPLVKAQCTNCGAMLDVESTKDAAICPHCGTAYIVEKAIQQFNIHNTNIIQNATLINESEYQRLIQAAEGFVKLGDNKSARANYVTVTQRYPQKFDGWFGVVACDIHTIMMTPAGTRVEPEFNSQELANARKLAAASDNIKIKNLLDKYIEFAKKHNAECDSMLKKVNLEFSDLNGLIQLLDNKKSKLFAKNVSHFGDRDAVEISLMEKTSFASKSRYNSSPRFGLVMSYRDDLYDHTSFFEAISYNAQTGVLYGETLQYTAKDWGPTYKSEIKFLGRNSNGDYLVEYEFGGSTDRGKATMKMIEDGLLKDNNTYQKKKKHFPWF